MAKCDILICNLKAFSREGKRFFFVNVCLNVDKFSKFCYQKRQCEKNKMISNYNELIMLLNKLFPATAVHEVEDARAILNKTKKDRKEQISSISLEIRKLNLLINKYKYQIRETPSLDEKKEKGIELNRLLKERQMLIKEYNLQRQVFSFQQLNDEAKIFACCRNLFKKYLTEELLKDYRLLDSHTNSVNITAFKDSRLFQEFNHIKDYVRSFIENYPERVKGGKYFTGIHKNISSLADLRTEIDAYFEKLNNASEKELNNIKKSHDGFEVIATYPKVGLQAVKLLSKRALNYEGSAMHHCVGSYADKVEKGQTEIYSLRDMGQENRELLPHATIEFKNGKVTQIKGPHDKAISFQYVEVTRKLVMHLAGTDDFNDIIEDKTLALSEKNNIGIHQGVDNKLYDIFNLRDGVAFDKIAIDSEYLHALPLSKMKINTLELCGKISENDIIQLFNCQNIRFIYIKDIIFEGKTLDLSQAPVEELDLKLSEAVELETFIAPQKIKHLALSGMLTSLKEIKTPNTLETLTLNGKFNSLKSLDLSFYPNLCGVDLMMSDFPLLKELKLPQHLQTFLGDTSKFEMLEELDFSSSDMTCFGKALNKNSEQHELKKLFKHMYLSRFSMSLTSFPKLRRFVFPDKIKQINLAQTCFDNSRVFDFSNCKELNILNLIFTNFPENSIFNLEKCVQLQELICSYNTLWHAKLPNNLTELNVYGEDTHTAQSLPLSGCHNLKKLTCSGFFPRIEDIPESVKDVTISQCTVHPDEVKTLDLSSYNSFGLDIHHTSSFKNLTKISFPKTISCLDLSLSQAPNLCELDFSKTTSNFHIGTLDFIHSGIKNWFLADKNLFKNIRKIYLNSEITPIIEPNLTRLPNIVFQLHPETSQKYVDQFQKFYPHAQLISAPNSHHLLKIKPVAPYLPPVIYTKYRGSMYGYFDFSL